MEITFRKATVDDVAEVVSYLRAFAVFNRIEDEFTATEESNSHVDVRARGGGSRVRAG